MIKLRIALAGAGLIGQEHARLLAAHPDTQLVAVADPAPAAAKISAQAGAAHFADYREMLDSAKPDGVIVALPNNLHLEAGLAAIERRIPLFIEKPVTDTIEAGRRLVAAGEKAGVAIQVGHHRRHAPDIQRARGIVSSGELGRILAVNGMWLAKKPLDYFDSAWRRAPGGGPLLINLIHDVDTLRYICGDIAGVQAVTANSARGFAVEDTVAVILRFESGALGTFLLSDSVPSPYVWDVAAAQALYLAHQPGDCYFIGGDKGTLAVPSMHVWTHQNDGDWRHPVVRTHHGFIHQDCYRAQLDNFVDVVRGKARPVVDGMDGLKTLATVEAIARAAITGGEIAVASLLD